MLAQCPCNLFVTVLKVGQPVRDTIVALEFF